MMISRNVNLNSQVDSLRKFWSSTSVNILAPPTKPTPLSDEQLNEIDDSTYRQNVRQMDEYKDDNPRGAGNRYNRS